MPGPDPATIAPFVGWPVNLRPAALNPFPRPNPKELTAMNRMISSRPTAKVIGSTIAAALTTVVIAVIKAIWPDLVISAELQGAITTILTFAAGYLTPPADADRIQRAGEGSDPVKIG